MSSNDDMQPWLRIDPDFGPPSEAAKEIFAAIGSALSTWTIVELEVAQVYMDTAHPHGGPAGVPAAFSTIGSFEARLKVIGALLSHSFGLNNPQNEEMLGKWYALADKCHKKNQGRNSLAHGLVSANTTDGKQYWFPYFQHSALMMEAMPHIEFHRTSKRLQRMDVKMIREKEDSFVRVYHRVRAFRVDTLLPLVRGKDRAPL